MSAITAAHYRTNVLFRLLAFLDNTGTQSFVLNKEVSEDGHFVNASATFNDSTAIAAILAASLKALRSNVRRLFKSVEEQEALLRVIGTGAMEPAVRTWDCMTWISSALPDTKRDVSAVDAPSASETAATDARRGEGVGDSEISKESDEGRVTESDAAMDAPHDETPSTNSPNAARRQAASLPLETTWSYLVCHPVSLLHYAEQVENELPIHLLMRLREVLGVPQPLSGASLAHDEADTPETSKGMTNISAPVTTAFSPSPLMEQILIDGLDEWMRSTPIEEVKRIVLACGVQPTVLASAFDQQQQQRGPSTKSENKSNDKDASTSVLSATAAAVPDSLVDFVVDVVFPVSAGGGTTSSSSPSSTAPTQSTTTSTPAEGLQDWLLLSYEKNHETIEVGEDEDEDTDGIIGADDDDDQPRRKAARAEGDAHASQSSTEEAPDSLGAWQPENGEEVLTADNIDRYLRECPQRIPKEILREKRKSISDAAITAFELENHYTAAELKKLIKDEVGAMTVGEATALMGTTVTADQIAQAAKATRKAQFVEWVLAAHRSVDGDHNGGASANETTNTNAK